MGSPPLTRGKAIRHPPDRERLGITPAYAGKSRGYDSEADGQPDHPRLRGEKNFTTQKTEPPVGSPPLTRGKDFGIKRSSRINGITPAYAGKSRLTGRQRRRSRDHPRLRGEKYTSKRQTIRQRGSPPLTRGKVKFRNDLPNNVRITPAYAGKSTLLGAELKQVKDHPRLRGEKCFVYASWRRYLGSPPLTRGKVPISNLSLFCAGITPAYAGKRFSGNLFLFALQDHPRLRGEKRFFRRPEKIAKGSPPLTRGKGTD